MGGAKSGNVASTLAADVFTQEVKRSWVPDMDPESLDRMLGSAVKLANYTVYDQASQFEDFNGMGTTLVALLIQGKKATIVNVGDSRVYRINADGIAQITVDHSLVQLMIRRGEITPEQARYFPGKNYITRAIGTEPSVKADIFHLRRVGGRAGRTPRGCRYVRRRERRTSTAPNATRKARRGRIPPAQGHFRQGSGACPLWRFRARSPYGKSQAVSALGRPLRYVQRIACWRAARNQGALRELPPPRRDLQ
jgi:hypothetical protein